MMTSVALGPGRVGEAGGAGGPLVTLRRSVKMRKSPVGEPSASVGKGCLFPSLIMPVYSLEPMQQNRTVDFSKLSSDLYTQHVAPPP